MSCLDRLPKSSKVVMYPLSCLEISLDQAIKEGHKVLSPRRDCEEDIRRASVLVNKDNVIQLHVSPDFQGYDGLLGMIELILAPIVADICYE